MDLLRRYDDGCEDNKARCGDTVLHIALKDIGRLGGGNQEFCSKLGSLSSKRSRVWLLVDWRRNPDGGSLLNGGHVASGLRQAHEPDRVTGAGGWVGVLLLVRRLLRPSSQRRSSCLATSSGGGG